ncbi:MAG: biotin transporter BioY [Ignavibacteriae bacterium]|nr:biotin transporter BioY [Ignavibacteriota bacterium]
MGFAAATAIGARIEIPYQPVPFTLQTMFVLLSGAFLGARNGALSQLLYLAVGAAGIPVFSMGGVGIAKLLGPTGGYLMAFPLAAAVVGYLVAEFKSLPAVALSMIVGLLAIFASGVLYLNAFYIHNISQSAASGFVLFTWWDVIKLMAAATIYREVAKRWPRLG